MTDRYTNNYRILGIPRGASWKQLRQAYKSLVNTWHPDRYQQDDHQRKLAENKTKEITQSYKELAEYYKKYGVLPVTARSTKVPAPEDMGSQTRPVSPEPSNHGTESSAAETPVPVEKSGQSTLVTRIIIGAFLAGIAYFAWEIVPPEYDNNSPAIEESTDKVPDTGSNTNLSQHSGSDKQFTIGSSLGEVYSSQGVPTKTENDIWFYGNSKVYFVNGRVQRWVETSDNPLNVRIAPRTEFSVANYFGKGSSKKEVREIQGAPEREAGNVWDYGDSRVYFEKDHVTGWQEAPLNPLKVR
ncbi:MAG: DnaJ domain-containing protein [Sulfuricaulis sp.]